MVSTQIAAPVFVRFWFIKHAAGGFILCCLLSGCQAVSTPEQVTTAFWEAMADGDLETARSHTLRASQPLVSRQHNLEDAALETGKVTIDGGNARVATVLTLQKPDIDRVLTFDTVLAKENQRWKVDYQQTLNNLLHQPFGALFKSLSEIGEAINKELENQIPLFEQQLKSFSEELIRQLEQFRRELEKSIPPDQQRQPPGST